LIPHASKEGSSALVTYSHPIEYSINQM